MCITTGGLPLARAAGRAREPRLHFALEEEADAVAATVDAFLAKHLD